MSKFFIQFFFFKIGVLQHLQEYFTSTTMTRIMVGGNWAELRGYPGPSAGCRKTPSIQKRFMMEKQMCKQITLPLK